jgi:chromosomal replication initiator protein
VHNRSSNRPDRADHQQTPRSHDAHRTSERTALLDHLQGLFSRELGEERFTRFFSNQTRLGVEQDRVRVTVPNSFTRDLLERRFGCDLRRVLKEESRRCGCDYQLSISIDDAAFESAPVRAETNGLAPAPIRRPRRRVNKSRLPELRHRLDEFIVGDANRVAHAAARRIAEGDDAGTCSPLFIHGACGLGKTHLLQGVANRHRQLFPDDRVLYLTAEVFTNDFVMAVQNGSMASFRKLYRGVSLLCIDDIHFVAGKTATQNELLHTLDAIAPGNARIVMASDAHPRAIAKFNTALVSRLISGAVVRLDHPDVELRTRIVEQLAKARSLPLAPGGAHLIAEHASTTEDASVRDLEGALTQVEAVWRLLPELAGPEGRIGAVIVQHALEMRKQGVSSFKKGSRNARPVKVETILRVVCEELEIELSEVLGQGKHRKVVLARSMAVYAARELTTRSYPEIAAAMARTSHSTVVSAFKRVSGQIAEGKIVKVGGPHDGLTTGALADRLIDRIRRECTG